jgi:hypothetical protein
MTDHIAQVLRQSDSLEDAIENLAPAERLELIEHLVRSLKRYYRAKANRDRWARAFNEGMASRPPGQKLKVDSLTYARILTPRPDPQTE